MPLCGQALVRSCVAARQSLSGARDGWEKLVHTAQRVAAERHALCLMRRDAVVRSNAKLNEADPTPWSSTRLPRDGSHSSSGTRHRRKRSMYARIRAVSAPPSVRCAAQYARNETAAPVPKDVFVG